MWLLAMSCSLPSSSGDEIEFAPQPTDRQIPLAMHTEMDQMPSITVGRDKGDLVGSDNRVLQAAVDYIAGLGGGVVEIGPGDYLMCDALHLRSGVTVRGCPGETRLCKAAAATSPLAIDGDFGEEQITLREPVGFEVGCGVAIWDDRSGGFHTTTARITGRRDSTFSIDRPLMADCMVRNHARAATVFPVVSGRDIQNAVIENLVIVGNKDNNVSLNGCRGAGIYLYRGHGTIIRNCVVQAYHGDGISFQQSNDVVIEDCASVDNAALGLHPGSGSQRPVIRRCVAKGNGTDGLFLCWRVRHGLFEENTLENNGRYGISIGHKDSDNLLQRNTVRRNGHEGVYFRFETAGMAAHRNRLVENIIEDNGTVTQSAGIRIRGETDDLVFERNTIRDTRGVDGRTQTTGILIEPQVGDMTLVDNEIQAQTPIDDRREKANEESE
jgi:parallel beta-helix repeat protein